MAILITDEKLKKLLDEAYKLGVEHAGLLANNNIRKHNGLSHSPDQHIIDFSIRDRDIKFPMLINEAKAQ